MDEYVLEVYRLDQELNIKSKNDHILDEKIITQLSKNISSCFPEKQYKVCEYYAELMDFLYPGDIKEVKNISRCKYDFFPCCFNKTFRIKPLTKENEKNRYEIAILYKKEDYSNVISSCLLQFKPIYNLCEIHEVCNGPGIIKICKPVLMPKVKNYLENECDIILIYCENKNGPACNCYSNIFCDKIIESTNYTGFIYFTNSFKRKRIRNCNSCNLQQSKAQKTNQG